jgi:hypothetical protein
LIGEFESELGRAADLAVLYDVGVLLQEKLEDVQDLLKSLDPPRFDDTVSAVIGCLAMWADGLRRKPDESHSAAVWAVIKKHLSVFEIQRRSLGLPSFQLNPKKPLEPQVRAFINLNQSSKRFKEWYYTQQEAEAVRKLSLSLEICRAINNSNVVVEPSVQALIDGIITV